MPVLVSLLAIDIGATFDSDLGLTAGNIVGFVVRYMILFLLGGFVAYLHDDETKPFKLFELGVAAPALITSLITAQGVVAEPQSSTASREQQAIFSLIGVAHAGELHSDGELVVAAGFFNDLIKGLGGGVYQDIGKKRAAVEKQQARDERAVEPKPSEQPKPIVQPEVEPELSIEIGADPAPRLEAVELAPVRAMSAVPVEPMVEGAKVDAAKAKAEALAEAEKAKATRLRAEAARASAEALEHEYQATLATVKAAEARAEEAEKRVILLEQRSVGR